jgi:hypothetical protein
MKLSNKAKMIYYVICLIVGIISFASGYKSDNAYLYGFGTGLIVASSILLIKQIVINKDPKKLHQQEVAENDERNKMICTASFAITFRLSILLEAIFSVILAYKSLVDLSELLGFVVCIQLIIYLITYFIISKKN